MSSITAFAANVDQAPGYYTAHGFSIRQKLVSIGAIAPAKLLLGCPAVAGSSVLVGTDDADASSHFLMLIDGTIQDVRRNPVQSFAILPLQIRDVAWIGESAVIALGEGEAQLIEMQQNQLILGRSLSIHSQPIRELAVKNSKESIIASGGYEGRLCITDIDSASSSVQSVMLRQKIIGSVKWTELNGNVCVSVTTDDGDYLMFDTRCDMTTAVVEANHIKTDLFTHCRYTDYDVLLGYGDGGMKHIDMRMADQLVCSAIDPYVEGIGGIEYNSESQSFVVSGYTDCSVWKLKSTGEANLWSHSIAGPDTIMNANGYVTSATYYDADTVLMSDSDGHIKLMVQHFSRV